jgi:hypothetical protein
MHSIHRPCSKSQLGVRLGLSESLQSRRISDLTASSYFLLPLILVALFYVWK